MLRVECKPGVKVIQRGGLRGEIAEKPSKFSDRKPALVVIYSFAGFKSEYYIRFHCGTWNLNHIDQLRRDRG